MEHVAALTPSKWEQNLPTNSIHKFYNPLMEPLIANYTHLKVTDLSIIMGTHFKEPTAII